MVGLPEGGGAWRPAPPEASDSLIRWARRAGRPLERFLQIESASGILLLVAAVGALAWANSPWAEGYRQLWLMPLGVRIGDWTLERPLRWFVNDGLMVLFFYVVGMEIRRETHQGVLSEWRRAALPVAAAVGGMLLPAVVYLGIAGGPETGAGWGIPMATDIAFAVGLLALLGRRVPTALRVLLLALAVIDDLGAILMIAMFYAKPGGSTGGIVAAAGFATVIALQRLGVRARIAYVTPALVAWAGIYAAGFHPTIAGVILGLLTPVRAWLGPDGFVQVVRSGLDRLVGAAAGTPSSHPLAETLRVVGVAGREAISPADSLIAALHPWVAYGILPVFAFANAGVPLTGVALDERAAAVLAAVVAGLVVGKPLGIVGMSWLALRLGLGRLPAGLSLRHLAVLGCVAGVGFTMALFIAPLAFADAQLLAAAKLGVLLASLLAALLGLLLGRALLRGNGDTSRHRVYPLGQRHCGVEVGSPRTTGGIMRWTRDGAVAVWDGSTLTLTERAGECLFSREAIDSYATADALASHLGAELAAEILATVRHGPLDRTPGPPGRPHIARVVGFGPRGTNTPGAWISGRKVRFSALDGPDFEVADLAAGGIPENAGLVPEARAALWEAVTALAALPCDCGTGAAQISEHGQIERLQGSVQDPRVPMTYHAAVGRCRVCGRCRVYTTSGDEAYEMRHAESLPVGPDAE
jgi:NhaA family Na+:H+ antiporter